MSTPGKISVILRLNTPSCETEGVATIVRKSMVAVLSDIHCNLPALEAVFAEMDKLGVRWMLELGM